MNSFSAILYAINHEHDKNIFSYRWERGGGGSVIYFFTTASIKMKSINDKFNTPIDFHNFRHILDSLKKKHGGVVFSCVATTDSYEIKLSYNTENDPLPKDNIYFIQPSKGLNKLKSLSVGSIQTEYSHKINDCSFIIPFDSESAAKLEEFSDSLSGFPYWQKDLLLENLMMHDNFSELNKKIDVTNRKVTGIIFAAITCLITLTCYYFYDDIKAKFFEKQNQTAISHTNNDSEEIIQSVFSDTTNGIEETNQSAIPDTTHDSEEPTVISYPLLNIDNLINNLNSLVSENINNSEIKKALNIIHSSTDIKKYLALIALSEYLEDYFPKLKRHDRDFHLSTLMKGKGNSNDYKSYFNIAYNLRKFAKEDKQELKYTSIRNYLIYVTIPNKFNNFKNSNLYKRFDSEYSTKQYSLDENEIKSFIDQLKTYANNRT